MMTLSETVARHPEMGSRFVFSVGHNMPGYLPDGDLFYAETWEAAKAVLTADLEYELYNAEDDETWEADEILSALRDLDEAEGPDFMSHAGMCAWWIDCLEVTEQEWHEIRDC